MSDNISSPTQINAVIDNNKLSIVVTIAGTGLKGDPGLDGATPAYGIDYSTPEQLALMASDINTSVRNDILSNGAIISFEVVTLTEYLALGISVNTNSVVYLIKGE